MVSTYKTHETYKQLVISILSPPIKKKPSLLWSNFYLTSLLFEWLPLQDDVGAWRESTQLPLKLPCADATGHHGDRTLVSMVTWGQWGEPLKGVAQQSEQRDMFGLNPPPLHKRQYSPTNTNCITLLSPCITAYTPSQFHNHSNATLSLWVDSGIHISLYGSRYISVTELHNVWRRNGHTIVFHTTKTKNNNIL